MEPGLGPGSLDQMVWLTGYRDWAGGPVMPLIKIKQPVDGDRTIELGNTRKNTGKARDRSRKSLPKCQGLKSQKLRNFSRLKETKET